jgi:hypothetical protein
MDKPEWCFDSEGNPYLVECKQSHMFAQITAYCRRCLSWTRIDVDCTACPACMLPVVLLKDGSRTVLGKPCEPQ